MKWIRRLLFGSGAELGVPSTGGFLGAGRASVGMLLPDEGPFDRPPEVPAELDAETLPWELREDDPT